MKEQKEYIIINTSTTHHNCLPHSFATWLLAEAINSNPSQYVNNIWNKLGLGYPNAPLAFLKDQGTLENAIKKIGVHLRLLYGNIFEKNKGIIGNYNLKDELNKTLLTDFDSYQHQQPQTGTFNGMLFIQKKFKELANQKKTGAGDVKDSLTNWWNKEGYILFARQIKQNYTFLGEDFLAFLKHHFNINVSFKIDLSPEFVNLSDDQNPSSYPLTFTAHYNGTDHWSAYLTEEAFNKINQQGFGQLIKMPKPSTPSAIIPVNPFKDLKNISALSHSIELKLMNEGNEIQVITSSEQTHCLIEIPINLVEKSLPKLSGILKKFVYFTDFKAEDNNAIAGWNAFKNEMIACGYRNKIIQTVGINNLPNTIEKITIYIGDENKTEIRDDDSHIIIRLQKDFINSEEMVKGVIDTLDQVKTFTKFNFQGELNFKSKINTAGENFAYQNQLSHIVYDICKIKFQKLIITFVESEKQIEYEKNDNEIIIKIPSSFLQINNIEFIKQQLDKLTSFEEFSCENIIQKENNDLLLQAGRKIAARNILLINFNADISDKGIPLLQHALYSYLTRTQNKGWEGFTSYYCVRDQMGEEHTITKFKRIHQALKVLGKEGISAGLKSIIDSPQVDGLSFFNKNYDGTENSILSIKDILEGFIDFFKYNPGVRPVKTILIHSNETLEEIDIKHIRELILELIPLLKSIREMTIDLRYINFELFSEKEGQEFYNEFLRLIEINKIQATFEMNVSKIFDTHEIKKKNHQLRTARNTQSRELIRAYKNNFGDSFTQNNFSIKGEFKWRLTTELQTEITHQVEQQSITQQQQTQQQTQQQIQQRQQQIQQQQQRNKSNEEILEKEFPSSSLLDFRGAEIYCSEHPVHRMERFGVVSFRERYEQWPIALLSNLTNAKQKVDFITHAALHVFVLYPEVFTGGLKLDNLPDGFYIAKSKNGIVLDFNNAEIYKNPKKNGLTLKVRSITHEEVLRGNKLFWEGDAKQFGINSDRLKEISEINNFFLGLDTVKKEFYTLNSSDQETMMEKRNLLHEMIGYEFTQYVNTEEYQDDVYQLFNINSHQLSQILAKDKITLAKVLLQPYLSLIESLSYKELMGLIQLFYKTGTVGVVIALNVVNNVKLHHESFGQHYAFYEKFVQNILFGPKQNKLGSFPCMEDPEYISAFKKLLKFNSKQLTWFYVLLEQHLQYAPAAYLPDLITAFSYFCDQLKNIHPKLELSSSCELKSKNMVTGLDRLLTILNHAIDPIEQMRLLEGLDLNYYGAYFAVKENQFYLVTQDMYLNKNDFNGPNRKILTKQDLNYTVDLISLRSRITCSDYLTTYKPSFFRYLGTQQYLATYSKYKLLVEKIDKANFNSQIVLNDLVKNYLLFFCAQAISGILQYQKFEPNDINPIISELLTIKEPEELLDKLLDCIDENCTLTFDNIELFVKIFKDIDNDLWKKYKNLIKNCLETHKNHFLFALRLYLENKTHEKTRALPLSNYLETLDAINTSYLESSLKEKLFKLISIIQFDNNIEINSLIDQVQNMNQDVDKSILISILFDKLIYLNFDTINNDSNKTFTFKHLLTLLKNIDQNPSKDCQQIIEELNTGCQFNRVLKMHSDTYLVEMLNNAKDEIIKVIKNFPFASNIIQLLENNDIEGLCSAYSNYEWMLPNSVKQQMRPLLMLTFIENAFDGENLDENQKQEIVNLIDKKLCAKLSVSKLVEFRRQLNIIVTHLSKICKKWPTDFNQINSILSASTIDLSKFTLHGFERILEALINIPQGQPFPHELLSIIIKNYKGNQQKEAEELIISHLNAIVIDDQLQKYIKNNLMDIIIWFANQPNVSENYKQLELTLQQFVALRNENLQAYITLSTNIKNLLNNGISSDQVIEIINKLIFLTKLDNLKNAKNAKILTQFIEKFVGTSLHSVTLLENLITLPYEFLPHAIQIIIRFDVTDFDNITNILEYFKNSPLEEIKEIATLYYARPYPNASTLYAFLSKKKRESIAEFIESFERDPKGDRKEKLGAQFDRSKVETVLTQTISLRPYLNSPKQQENFQILKDILWQQFQYINLIGHSVQYPLYFEPQTGKTLAIKDCSCAQLRGLINELKERYQNETVSHPKSLFHLQFIAVAREMYFRTNDKFPYSTQILSILYALETGDARQIAAISTGQGKTLISALYAAIKWFEGCTIDIGTSNVLLANDGYKENRDFFTALGAEVNDISPDSPKGSYKTGGIHYGARSNIALYEARARIDNEKLSEGKKRVLIADEMDFHIFDSATNHVLSTSLEPLSDPYYSQYKNLYPIIYHYIVENENGKALVTRSKDNPENRYIYLKDIQDLLTSLEENPEAEKELNRLSEKLEDKKEFYGELASLLRDAISTNKLKEDVDYSVSGYPRQIYTEGAWRETYDVYVINKAGVVEKDTQIQFGGHVHNFIKSKLNYEESKTEKYRYFPVNTTLSSSTPLNSMQSYDEILGLTGTPGSSKELDELTNDCGFTQIYRMPPHNPSKRIDLPIIYARNGKRKLEFIKNRIENYCRKQKHPILFLCKDMNKAKALYAELAPTMSADVIFQSILGDETEEVRQGKLKAAGKSNTVTIAGPSSTRGVDILLKELAKVKGLFTSFLYYPLDERHEDQGLGRSGRDIDPGLTEIIVDLEEFEEEYFISTYFPPDASKLSDVRRREYEVQAESRHHRESVGNLRDQYYQEFLTWWQSDTCQMKINTNENFKIVALKKWAEFLKEFENLSKELKLSELPTEIKKLWQTCKYELESLSRIKFTTQTEQLNDAEISKSIQSDNSRTSSSSHGRRPTWIASTWEGWWYRESAPPLKTNKSKGWWAGNPKKAHPLPKTQETQNFDFHPNLTCYLLMEENEALFFPLRYELGNKGNRINPNKSDVGSLKDWYLSPEPENVKNNKYKLTKEEKRQQLKASQLEHMITIFKRSNQHKDLTQIFDILNYFKGMKREIKESNIQSQDIQNLFNRNKYIELLSYRINDLAYQFESPPLRQWALDTATHFRKVYLKQYNIKLNAKLLETENFKRLFAFIGGENCKLEDILSDKTLSIPKDKWPLVQWIKDFQDNKLSYMDLISNIQLYHRARRSDYGLLSFLNPFNWYYNRALEIFAEKAQQEYKTLVEIYITNNLEQTKDLVNLRLQRVSQQPLNRTWIVEKKLAGGERAIKAYSRAIQIGHQAKIGESNKHPAFFTNQLIQLERAERELARANFPLR